MKIMTIGLDLAKNPLQLHGVNERGKALQPEFSSSVFTNVWLAH